MARTKGRFNANGTVHEEQAPAAAVNVCRTALYARLSVERASEPSGSIQCQLDIMKTYLVAHPDLTYCGEYMDDGFSGTNFDRPGFMRMMEDVRNGEINCIMVKDLSRFGRDYLETTNYLEVILPFLGVRFISVNDHFDTADKISGNKALEVALKNLVNDMYAKDTSKRISVVKEQDAAKGKFMGSNAPYGYVVNRKDPMKHYLIDEASAAVVKDIYRMALEGKGLRDISLELQRRNLSIPGQYLKTGHLYQELGDPVKVWHIGTISNILRNQAYIGNTVSGKRRSRLCDNEKQHFTDKSEWIITENTHEPIIDKETFGKIRALLTKKAEDSTFGDSCRHRITHRDDRYEGLIFCGNCGRPMQLSSQPSRIMGVRDRQQSRIYYFYCGTNYDLKNKGGCNTRITMPNLDQIVLEALRAQAMVLTGKDGKDIQEFLDTATKQKLAPLQRAARQAEADIQKEEHEGSRKYEDYVMGKISREELEAWQKESAEKTERLKGDLADTKARITARKKELSGVRKLVNAVLGKGKKVTLTRELLQLAVKKIIIYPGFRIEITWNFEDYLAGYEETFGKGRHAV